MRIVNIDKLQTKYDVIIIGAGIAGLTCGAYLAKKGLKVLIVEHHSIPGGFCTSFKRGDFIFDIGVHYLGNIHETGVMRRLIDDLDLDSELRFIRINPSDVVFLPDRKIIFRNDFDETVHNIQLAFPNNATAIKEFCSLLNNDNFLVLYKTFRNKTFRQVLDQYFNDEEIKSFFSILLGNIGLPSTKVSALTAAVMYRDYIFRGGYYPRGGMQKFPDALAKRFLEYGGDLLLNKTVTKIKVCGGKVEGILIEDSYLVHADYLVSNCSARQTFCELLGEDYLPGSLREKLNQMIPSPSAFIVYFALKDSLDKQGLYSNMWYCPSLNIDEVYEDSLSEKVNVSDFLFVSLASLHDDTLCPRGYQVGHLITLVPYMNQDYWQENQNRIEASMIKTANDIVPGFSANLYKTYPATPLTIMKYTKADRGAIYGWASILSQTGSVMGSETFIPNLYMAGHWATLESGQGGVTMAAFSGRNVARAIANNLCVGNV